MIALRRVRLINWHNFVDDTLEFDKITYLIGVNAVGKTTILDAIRYCLTTNRNFNALGNRKSARTLQGSVHGKQRGENVYTRRGHTVSYIGVEFLDQRAKKPFVITVRVESESPEQELRHVRQTWYLSPSGVTLEDLPFLDPATNAPSSRDRFSTPMGKMPPIERQSDAWNQICQRLGIGKADSQPGRKFGAVFPMGTSLDEIHDFRTFISEYILPQPELDVEALQKDEQELENLQEVLTLAQQRAQQLQHIVELGDQALEKERDTQVNQGLIYFAQYQADAAQQTRLTADLAVYRDRLQRLDAQYEEARQQAELAHTAYQKAWKALQDSDDGKFLEALRDKKENLQRELLSLQKRVSAFRNAQSTVTDLLQKAQALYRVEDALYPEAIRQLPQRVHAEQLDALGREMPALESAVEQADEDLRDQIRQCRKDALELDNKIRQLEKGRFVYPDKDRANLVKTAINEAFAGQGLTQDAKVLCELLYMRDDNWQDCAEACLGNRRFDILVSPEHYGAAKHAFEGLGEAVGSVSLLDSAALRRAKIQTEPDSLAAKVGSENPLAQAYVDDLLGGIVCCEDSAELEEHPHSATKDLLRHYPYRLARMKRQSRYIGLEAKKQQLEEAKEEQKHNAAQLQALEARRSGIHGILELAQKVIHGGLVAVLREDWDCECRHQQTGEQLQQVGKEIQEWECKPLLRGLQMQEQTLKAEWDNKLGHREEIAAEQKTQRDAIMRCERDILRVQNQTAASLAVWNGWEHPQLMAEAERKYAESAKRRAPEEIVKNQTNYQRQLENERDSFVNNQLIRAQQEYNRSGSGDIAEGLGSIELFRALHDQLVHIDLERYSASLQKAKARCRERFRRDILYRMKDDICTAKRQFRELSRIMQELHYGEETYQFQVQESQDPERGRICRLIMSEQNREMTQEDSIFNLASQDDPAYEAQIDELVERVLSAARAKVEALQKGRRPDSHGIQWLDYREYLDYDIIINNVKTGQSVPLSKVSQDSSGGENQAPFYVAICASLLQIYQKCENGIRLVLLDEAFSKMTSDRIRPMMQMFRQMDLQVVMITTVEKASAIYPLCDVTYSIVKSGSRNAMAPFYLQVDGNGA